MPPQAKNYLIILLTATTVTIGVIAWQQTERLAALQNELGKAAAAATVAKPRPVPALTATPPAVAATPGVASVPSGAGAAAATDMPATPTAPRGRGNRPDFAALMANPEFFQAMNLQQRAALDGRYAELFKKLQLPPANLEKLKTLLVERQTTRLDVLSSARAQGLDPRINREELNQLTAAAQAEIDTNIKTTLGETAFNQYQNYETTQPQRSLVSQLDQRLSYSGAPLTPSQAEFLVSALATNPSATSAEPAPAGPVTWGGGRSALPIADAVIQRAQSVLTPDQLAALKQLQSEQAAQQKMHDLMRNPPKPESAPLR
jgi:hypothetical protein